MTTHSEPTHAEPLRDVLTMLRRDLRHSLRNPMMTLSGIGTPVIMMLIFVGMFGHIMSPQLGGVAGSYVAYLTPGVILMGLGAGVATTAINLNVDKSEGVITRFRTMAISRTSVLTGPAIGSVIRSLASVTVVLLVATALGFRGTTNPLRWLAAYGLIALVAVAFTWLGTAFGLLASSPATANSMALIPQFLPLLSSGFVPPDQMPAGMRWFGAHQPFTPLIETLRDIVTGRPLDSAWLYAVGWCLVIWAGGFLWARRIYNREQGAPAAPSVGQLMSH
ncbi:MAG: ABC transporter permease [Nostocoides sp.]